MKPESKIFYDKMVDYKRFAVLLLTVGAFFYLGAIIPSDTKTVMDINIMVLSSISFLLVAILLFTQSKKYQIKLNEIENSQNQ